MITFLYDTRAKQCDKAFSVEHGDPERIQTAVDDQFYEKLSDHDTFDGDRTAVEQGAVDQTGKHGIKGESKEKRTIRF